MKKPDRTQQINIRISQRERAVLEQLAAPLGESMSAVIRRLIFEEAKRKGTK